MKAARARFTRRALVALAGILAAASATTATLLLLLRGPVPDTGAWPLLALVGSVLLLLGLGGASIWNWVALIRISRLKPGALVFLARREPTLVPDLPVYLHRNDLAVDVSDRWVPAVIDERGIAPWSGGFRPRELFVMAWSELGEVTAEEFRSVDGRAHFGISVDVRPFPTPLIVRVGYARFGLQAAFDRAGTVAVAEAAAARRPVLEGSA
jgi:hypothetical protein